MRVTVFGIGYVGLVQAAVLAQVGHHVVCVDIDEKKVDGLNNGVIPFYEPGLEVLVKENCELGRLRFISSPEEGVSHGEMQFIAVGTPPNSNGSADIKYVMAVADIVASKMKSYKVVVNKSTVPVGTADKVFHRIKSVLTERNENIAFDVVSNPEFLKEGAAVGDCKKPDRIVIGTDSDKVKSLMRELYAPFNRNHDKIIFMDVRSAELTKYAANCMLATKISFMNEMSNLAEKLGADIEMIRQGIGSDPRIGYQFIYPGCGFGGSCFPKDISALVHAAKEIGVAPSILEAVEAVNSAQKQKLFGYLHGHFNGNLTGVQIALWGLSFKPNTDDMREAPSRILIDKLLEEGAIVKAFDPKAMDECQRIYGNNPSLLLMGTKESCLSGSDALVICTEWNQFRAPDFDQIGSALKEKVIVDGRNLFDPEALKQRGFVYYAIGRGASVRFPE